MGSICMRRSANEVYAYRYGAGEIGTQHPSKKTQEVIAVLEGEGEKEEGK